VLRLLRISRTVIDLERASAFYRDALDFQVTGKSMIDGAAWVELMGTAGANAASLTMRLGAQEIELVAFDPPGKPYPPSSGSTDLWFQHAAIVVSDMDEACKKLRRYSFDVISVGGPQRLPPGSGSVIAYKFRDPDGHPLELIQFPARSGDAVGQRKQAVFLGIDHSAIDADNLQQSIDFYTDVLGFSVASRSVNSGLAQQRLDGAPEVLVNVVALQPLAAGPPHVELLAYE
jgi:catechol 2,3-dioxygenase-like lactoylglutathione lyase family enzyme